MRLGQVISVFLMHNQLQHVFEYSINYKNH